MMSCVITTSPPPFSAWISLISSHSSAVRTGSSPESGSSKSTISGLDPVRTALLCELIKEVHAENGGCYCVITHDIMSARRVAEHLCVLWKGRIVESGPAEDLFASENPFVRQFLSGEAAGPLGME